jgi:hypothetical protein
MAAGSVAGSELQGSEELLPACAVAVCLPLNPNVDWGFARTSGRSQRRACALCFGGAERTTSAGALERARPFLCRAGRRRSSASPRLVARTRAAATGDEREGVPALVVLIANPRRGAPPLCHNVPC